MLTLHSRVPRRESIITNFKVESVTWLGIEPATLRTKGRCSAIEPLLQVKKWVYHITYGSGVQEHSAINRKNALVQYRFLLPRFSIIVENWAQNVICDDVAINITFSRKYIGRRQC